MEHGRDGMADAGLSLYPNPAAETIRIRAEGSRIGQVAIMDMSGLTVYESAAGLDYEESRYNVSGLQAGAYFARVQTGVGYGSPARLRDKHLPAKDSAARPGPSGRNPLGYPAGRHCLSKIVTLHRKKAGPATQQGRRTLTFKKHST